MKLRVVGLYVTLCLQLACGATQSAPAGDALLGPEVNAEALAAVRRDNANITRYVLDYEDVPSFGAPNPTVRVDAFIDYMEADCIPTERAWDRIRDHFPDDVRIYIRPWYGRNTQFSYNAATAAREAYALDGARGLAMMHGALLAASPNIDPRFIATVSQQFGLDGTAIAQAISAHAHDQELLDNFRLANALHARNPPTYLINGRVVPFETRNQEAYERIVREEVARVRAIRNAGVDEEHVHDVLYANATVVGVNTTRAPDGRYIAPEEATDNQIYALPVPSDAPSRGPSNAPITLQVFCNLTSPACRNVASTLAPVENAYRGRVRVVYRHLVIDETGQVPAEASVEARAQRGDDGFWAMHDRLLAHRGALDLETVIAVGRDVGLDEARLRRALEGKVHAARVASDKTAFLAARRPPRGAPTFFVNGMIIRGRQPLTVFQRVIDSALSRGATHNR